MNFLGLRNILLAIFLYQYGFAAELETSYRGEVSFFYSYRQLNQNIDPINKSSDLIFIGSPELNTRYEPWQFDVRPEIKLISGGNNQLSTNNPNYIDLQSPLRLAETRFHLGNPGDKTVVYGDWEKLRLAYNSETVDISLGRKPFSLGVFKYLSIWNKFLRTLPTIATLPLYYGSDGIETRFKLSQMDVEVSKHYYDLGREQVDTFQTIYNGDDITVHFMVGRWWQENVGGLAFSKDLYEGTLLFEFLQYSNHNQVGIGYERAVGEYTNFSFEVMHQNEGVRSSLDYTPILNSRFRVFQAYLYSHLALTYTYSTGIKFNALALTNWVDLGTAFNLGATFFISNQWEGRLIFVLPSIRENSEFSKTQFEFSDGTKFGVPAQAMAQLSWNF